MFTGIIEETGIIRMMQPVSAGARMTIEARKIIPGLKPGDSVAVNGACLTAVEIQASRVTFDLSLETMRRTTFQVAREGMSVNLERSLAVGDRFGGHFVQGHADGVGRLKSVAPSGDGLEMVFTIPAALERYLVLKGSIAVDGISLTIASLGVGSFTVAVIPYTLRVTHLRNLKPGDEVNLEADILAKYVERFLHFGVAGLPDARHPLTVDQLKEQGF